MDKASFARWASAAWLALAACGAPPSDPEPEPEPSVEDLTAPSPGGLRKLTVHQYRATIESLFGTAAATLVDAPTDTPEFGLDAIGAADHTITPAGVETYERTARLVGRAVIDDPEARANVMTCAPVGIADHACYRQIAERFGRLAWRRHLEEEEIDALVAVAVDGAEAQQSGDRGVAAMVSFLLQSPDFLYQVEIGDPSEVPGRRVLRPGEVASRMSFFLLGHGPDEDLLDRADAGDLDDEDGVRAVATELIARPEATYALRDFYEQVFELRTLSGLEKDPETFPAFDDETRDAIAMETLIFLDDIVWTRDADAREMFDAPYTFVNAHNAWIYGVSASSDMFEKRELPGRVGILSQPSFLAHEAHATLTSPTRRGLFVLTKLLCDPVPPPPPGVPAFPAEDGEPKTMRARLEAHAHGTCLACHEQTDSIGLALEHFDAVGAYREKDQGLPIDDADELPALGSFEGLAGLAARLRESEDTPVCMARQIFRQSMGHMETKGEAAALEAIDEAFARGGFRIRGLLVEIAASPAFRLVGEPK